MMEAISKRDIMAAPIRRSPGHGKKIDTLHYDLVSPADGAKRTVEMHLFMSKSFNGEEPPYETTGLSFTLRCPEAGIDVSGTDANILVSVMRSRLDRAFAIEWKPWFIVKIDPSRPYGQRRRAGLPHVLGGGRAGPRPRGPRPSAPARHPPP